MSSGCACNARTRIDKAMADSGLGGASHRIGGPRCTAREAVRQARSPGGILLNVGTESSLLGEIPVRFSWLILHQADRERTARFSAGPARFPPGRRIESEENGPRIETPTPPEFPPCCHCSP